MKAVVFLGDSLSRLREFPESARATAGFQLHQLQRGLDPDDWLWGDKGNDTLSGGAGADLFYSQAGAGIDRITDFNYAEGPRATG